MRLYQVPSSMFFFIVIFVLLSFARAEIEHEAVGQSIEDTPVRPASILSKDCAKSYSAKCLKLDVVSLFDRLSEQDDFGM